jgi:transcription-repair coupling factor (superfamily II helicase)
MKDLEIRGAGNLLGGEQSGHIAASASTCTSGWSARP